MADELNLPKTCLPDWGVADLPEPQPLSWRHWTRFIGPGIVMMGIQIGGGEWLFGPEITARYGGGLMWIATVAIVLQVFYNIECGRYALYCGEPVITGFMRTPPGPGFWAAFFLLLNIPALIPALSTHAAAILVSIYLDRPPGADDGPLVTGVAYACLGVVALPILVGGKIYNMLQAVMTAKVVVVLGFCLLIGVTCVSPSYWWNIISGFGKFGNVPIETVSVDETGKKVVHDEVVNAVAHRWETGEWPVVALAQIAVLGAFAGYAGGGGLSNSTYSNYVRDKGWGMGRNVGAIASAVGGKNISLSHLGKVFPLTPDNMRKWRGWWKYILTDQLLVWGPGCFVGMAVPALLSLQFASSSPLYYETKKLDWAQAIITSDGMRHSPLFTPAMAHLVWICMLLVGLMVMLPSQMSIVDDVCRRWTDLIWSANPRVRNTMSEGHVNWIYYSIFTFYVSWTFVAVWLFGRYGNPKLQGVINANLNNLAIGLTSFLVLWINCRYLPRELRPKLGSRLAMVGCGLFYVGISILVFFAKLVPELQIWWNGPTVKAMVN